MDREIIKKQNRLRELKARKESIETEIERIESFLKKFNY